MDISCRNISLEAWGLHLRVLSLLEICNKLLLNDLAGQPKSKVSIKDGTAPDNKQSDTLEEMIPRVHPVSKQNYHFFFVVYQAHEMLSKMLTQGTLSVF